MPNVSGGLPCECFHTCVGPMGVVSHPCLTVQSLAEAHGVYRVVMW